MKYERQVSRLAFLTGLPGVVLSLYLMWNGGAPARLIWTVGLLLGGAWLVTTLMLRERVIRPLQTLSNMLAALREGDYSIRARGAERDDALGLALLESNLLGETLRSQRLGAMEATALLRTVMAEIDVAILAFDDGGRLRLVNRAGERLLAQPSERLLGRTALQLGLESLLEGESPRTTDATFGGASGRWEVRRGGFRQDGRPHMLLVIADVSKTLREQELVAWQRIVRVLSHEINNSLAPIKSLAGSMRSLLDRQPPPADVEADLRRGLDVIGGRSEALVRFMSAYARLARHGRRSPDQVDPAERIGGRPRRGRGSRSSRERESLRAVLYDEARGLGHRTRFVAPDRRGPWRNVLAGEPARPSGLCRDHPAAPADLNHRNDGIRRLAPVAVRMWQGPVYPSKRLFAAPLSMPFARVHANRSQRHALCLRRVRCRDDRRRTMFRE